MPIVKLQGGLGNQLFQYAYARTRGIRSFDPSMLETGNPKRRYGLGDYNLDIELREPLPGEEVHEGYWQAERWFNTKLIRSELIRPKGEPTQQCRMMASRILCQPSCFIGVRRSDYLWPEREAFHGVLPLDYYTAAISKMPNPKFFIFTDDPEWCAKNFPYEVITVNGENEKHWDIWLMSFFRYAIIANSSFHWWGAWLGPQRGVIAPKKWFVNEPSEIVPERWITL